MARNEIKSKTRSARPALLSINEREFLHKVKQRKQLFRKRELAVSRGDRVSAKALTKELYDISNNLATIMKAIGSRFDPLAQDLDLLLDKELAGVMRQLLVTRSGTIDTITTKWQALHLPIVGNDYSKWQVMSVSIPVPSREDPTQNTQHYRVYYWLDTDRKPDLDADGQPIITGEDTLQPEYALHGIKSKIWYVVTRGGKRRYNNREILREALVMDMSSNYSEKILPRARGDAMTLYQIEERILAAKAHNKEPQPEQPRKEHDPALVQALRKHWLESAFQYRQSYDDALKKAGYGITIDDLMESRP